MKSTVRAYRWLLRLYPTGYRREFGDEMLQTFIDWHTDVTTARGGVGAVPGGLMLLDELRNIARQRRAALHAALAPSVAVRVLWVAISVALVLTSAIHRGE